jgi:hypothetical protein
VPVPINLKKALIRGGHTFWQAALAAFVIPTTHAFSLPAWESAAIAAAAAGASAAYHLVAKPTVVAIGKALTAKLIAARFGSTLAEIEQALQLTNAAQAAAPAPVPSPAPAPPTTPAATPTA